jgi:hypothetical protein
MRVRPLVASLALLPCLAAAQQPPAPTPAAPSATTTPPAAAPQQTAPAVEPAPLAGYNGGGFFLRDPNDLFVLFPKGRLQIDYYNFLNRGDPPVDPVTGLPKGANSTSDKRPDDTLFVRRARVELNGTFAKHFEFQIAGEFGSVPATGSYGTVADAFINVNYNPWIQLEVGQFDAPFTLENRTSDKVFDFMERSFIVRSFGVPSNKEDGAMLWGYAPNKMVYYSLGVFNGDGQSFKNQDNAPAVIGRAFIAPLARWGKGDRKYLEQLWVGGSLWWAQEVNLGGPVTPSASAGTQNDLAGMSTQGGFGFFSGSYGNGNDTTGAGVRSHLTPDGTTVKWAVEANVPWRKVGLRFELVHVDTGLAQYNDANQAKATILRSGPYTGGRLVGTGYYLELFGWIFGDVDYLGQVMGLEPNPSLKAFSATKQPSWGLMAAAKIEHLDFDVSGLSMTPDGTGKPDPAIGHYAIDALELGVNGWLSKHVRLTVNYVANFIGGFAPDKSNVCSSTNMTPGCFAFNLADPAKGNIFFGNVEHELLMRIAVGL